MAGAIAAKPTPTPTPPKPAKPPADPPTDLLTTGEAYEEAQRRGWRGSITTFRRWLKKGDRPADVILHPEEKAKYSPKSNEARWLSF
ncbi:MAG: hypothetical protein HC771_12255 [Synechococcales cyanobacterium CRU_2_2]|nr:hypothetical protein [Synechococcales cyanobacterium CRU_2_2]